MNDLHSYLMLVKRIHFYTMIVEFAAVVENEAIIAKWPLILESAQILMDQCVQWMKSIDEDVKKEVLTHSKTREMLSSKSLTY